MAHELEIIDGKASMAYARRSEADVPWHGLGFPVPENATPDEMLKAAQLDWTVEKKKAYVDIDGEQVFTGQEALVRNRDGKILTNVGPGWNPVQNHQAFEFFEEFVEAGDMTMETAGSLKGGEIVWALAKTKSSLVLFGEDQIDGYVLFTNPHQYGKTIDIRFTPVRVVCNNTLTMALKPSNKKSGEDDSKPSNKTNHNHRKKFDPSVARDFLVRSRFALNQHGEMAKLLGNYRADDDLVDDYIKELLGTKDLTRTGKKIKENIQEQPGADIREGTWWQVFNAVTYTVDHELGNKTSRAEGTNLESAWYGANAKRKTQALELAGNYIRKSSPMAA